LEGRLPTQFRVRIFKPALAEARTYGHDAQSQTEE
jgi:hypothetical protein